MPRHPRGDGDPLRPSDSAGAGSAGDPLRSADSAAQDRGGLHRQTSGAPDAGNPAMNPRPNPGDKASGPQVDPDLEESLGAELPLRGDQLEASVEAAKAEAAEWREKAMRAQADFENARKRLEARHADEVRRAGERVITDLLPVMDDLERAADHLVEVAPEMAEGIVAVQRKLLSAMKKEGVTQIDPIGEAFDPTCHQAVQTREDTELPDHSVCEVYQKGYQMHGRVLRPAMVVVCTGGPARE